MRLARTWWAPFAALALLLVWLGSTGRVELRTWVTFAVVPLVLLGLHFRERWQARMRGAYLAFLGVVALFYALPLGAQIRDNLQRKPHWDFLGFWLHARTAVLGDSFYDPQHARALAAGLPVDSAFRREIIDVGFWYPPPSMFLFWPLGLFERPTAMVFWYAFNLAVMAACVWLLWRTFFARRGPTELAACTALVLACHGTWLTFFFSQTSFVALLAVLLFGRRRDGMLRGVWAAVALFVKPLLAAVVLAPLAARRWRTVAGFVVAVVALILASLAAFGTRTFADYVADDPAKEKPGWIYDQPTNQSLLGLILRAGGDPCTGADCATHPLFLGAAAVLGAITLFVGLRLARRDDEWALALYVLYTLLAWPVSQVFYSVLLIPVLLMLWRERETLSGGPWVVAAIAAAVYGLASFRDGLTTVLASALLWVTVAWIGVGLARKRIVAPGPSGGVRVEETA